MGSMSTEGETLQICPTLQVLDMSTLGDAVDVNPIIKFLTHTCIVYGRNLIIGLTSTASPRVDISSTCKVGQKLGVSLPLLTCSPSAWPSRLLYRRGRKTRRDLWITLYSNSLPYGPADVGIPLSAWDFLFFIAVHPSCWAQPAPYTVGSEALSWGYSGWGVALPPIPIDRRG